MVLVKILLLGKIKRKTVFGKYLERKIAFLDPKTIDLGKSQNMHFFIRDYSMVLMKIFTFFFHYLFLGKLERERVFGDFLDRK